jgi:phenylalanyl-tRNA synthetase beta chain
VDITNFVMLEMGQPMHAFDLNSVRGREIIVRRAYPNESIRTLDGKDRVMAENMLVIADALGATGIAGVMGGEGSEITEFTQEVLFESASFLGANIRQTGRSLGLRTEASGRFERGVNVQGTTDALRRALQLVNQLDAGDVVAGIIDVYEHPAQAQPVSVKPDYIRSLIGIPVPTETMVEILNSLNIQTSVADGELHCVPPDYRQDIVRGADIAEEVLRIYGYDRIETGAMRTQLQVGRISPQEVLRRFVREEMCAMGYSEVSTYSFYSPKVFDRLRLAEDSPLRAAARISNPLGEDFSLMRTTLIPSLLEVLATNMNFSVANAAIFEIGNRFLPKALPLEELPDEELTLCFGAYGDIDFNQMKVTVERLIRVSGSRGRTSFTRADAPYLHPGRSADVWVEDQLLGTFGEVHPDTAEAFGLPRRVYVAEINLAVYKAITVPRKQVEALPRYPAVERDIALVVREEVPVGDMLATIRKAGGRVLEDLALFDIYRGESLGSGNKSVAVKLTLRAADHTLTNEEIGAVVEKALSACEKSHQASLRA